MTQNVVHALGAPKPAQSIMRSKNRPVSTLSLRQTAPADWHRDRPAFPGDPYMDWESEPEQPGEPGWVAVTKLQNH